MAEYSKSDVEHELYGKFIEIQEKVAKIYDIKSRIKIPESNLDIARRVVDWNSNKQSLNSFVKRQTCNTIEISTYQLYMCFINIACDSLICFTQKNDIDPKHTLYTLFCLFQNKNENYGSSYKDFGIVGIFVRLNDKLNRILTLTNGMEDKVDEKIEDTLMDVINYCCIGMLLITDANIDY